MEPELLIIIAGLAFKSSSPNFFSAFALTAAAKLPNPIITSFNPLGNLNKSLSF